MAHRLGSSLNDECQIDAIPQAWAVISGEADMERASMAMNSVYERLVRRQDKLIALFDPPFDKGPLHPGLHQGLRSRHPRKWRPVHACSYVGRLGGCLAGRRRPRRGSLELDQSDLPRGDERSGRTLHGGAICRQRRRIWRAAAYRTRWLDMVHGFGRLAVSSGAGGHPWSSTAKVESSGLNPAFRQAGQVMN